MSRRAILALIPVLACMAVAGADPASSPMPESLPPLEQITAENAGRLRLVRTLEIADYRRGAISQCSLAFGPGGKLLVAACGESRVPIWDVATGAVVRFLYAAPQHIVACAFSPDGKSVASGGFDREIALWDVGTGERMRTVGALDSPIWELAFSQDGRTLASCGLASDIRLWDQGQKDAKWSYRGVPGYLSVAFSSAGGTIGYGSRWDGAGLLDARTGELVRKLRGPRSPVGDVAFSPSGDLLAAGADDNVIYLWNTATYELVATFQGHRGYVNGVAFSPDGSLLASGSHDKTLGIWDVSGRQLLATFQGHQDVVLRVAFSPDGRLIASTSWDGTLRLWGVPEEQPTGRVLRRVDTACLPCHDGRDQ